MSYNSEVSIPNYEATKMADNKRYWLHRISHHMSESYPLLEDRGLISIGWTGCVEHYLEVLPSKTPDNWGWVPDLIDKKWRSRWSLMRFLEMNKGDCVIIPTWGAFFVCEVVSDDRLVPKDIDVNGLKNWNKIPFIKNENGFICLDDNEESFIDLGFFRKVKIIAERVSRLDYADNALVKRMKVRQTNVNIDDLRDNVDSAVEAHKRCEPINLHSIILANAVDGVLDQIKNKVNHDQFEKLIKWYFTKLGADSHIPSKNERDKEGDADVVATFEATKTIIYVQAKHHEGKTDEWAVEQIDEYVENKASMGGDEGYSKIAWVVSTAEFSEECVRQAADNKIQLINGKEFAKMLLESGISGLSEFQND